MFEQIYHIYSPRLPCPHLFDFRAIKNISKKSIYKAFVVQRPVKLRIVYYGCATPVFSSTANGLEATSRTSIVYGLIGVC